MTTDIDTDTLALPTDWYSELVALRDITHRAGMDADRARRADPAWQAWDAARQTEWTRWRMGELEDPHDGLPEPVHHWEPPWLYPARLAETALSWTSLSAERILAATRSDDADEDCPECFGGGRRDCPECGGTDPIPCHDCDGKTPDCQECYGRGEVSCPVISVACKTCTGTGAARDIHPLWVEAAVRRVEAATATARAIRLRVEAEAADADSATAAEALDVALAAVSDTSMSDDAARWSPDVDGF